MSEQADQPATFNEKVRGPDRLRLGALVVAALAALVGAAVVSGASPSPSTTPGSSASPDASGDVDDRDVWMRGPFEGGVGMFGGGRFGFHRLGGISITAIAGTQLSLETENGWRRTIEVTDDVEISRAGETITLADLRVGDRVALRERRSDDGTFTITAIHVVLPSIAGEVTAIGADSITVRRLDGTTGTIHVDGDTRYRVATDEAASLGDIEVGMMVIAMGTERDDGSLDADAVRAGNLRRGLGHGRPPIWDRGGPWAPDLERAPETEPGNTGDSDQTSVG
jgi:hypothetical protein